MRCPFCAHEDTQVKDSRPAEDGVSIRRRRSCPECDSRFTTYERVQLRELNVLKKDDTIVPFDRDKLVKSITQSVRKRNISSDQIEQLVNNIVRELEGLGEADISSSLIGEKVMDQLKQLDQVAYVRFASVYREFREAKDFEEFIGNLETQN